MKRSAWVILMTDRRALGAPVRALSRARKGVGRTTLLLHRAKLFGTEKEARRWLKAEVARSPRWLYTRAEVVVTVPGPGERAALKAFQTDLMESGGGGT